MGIPRLRAYRGPAILSYGFRPFFLLGSLYAAFSILLWLPIYSGQIESLAHSRRSTGTSTKCCSAISRQSSPGSC